MPVLETQVALLAWPPTYAMTAEEMWEYSFRDLSDDTVMDKEVARTVSEAINNCAWVRYLVDEVQAGESAEGATAAIRDYVTSVEANPDQYSEGYSDIFRTMLDDAALGDVTVAQQYADANNCYVQFP